MKKINEFLANVFKKKSIKYQVFPLILVLLALFLTALNILTSDISLTVLSERYSNLPSTHNFDKELIKGSAFKGTFTAHENNLGLVYIRFNSFGRENNGFILFRLKNHNEKTWYIQSKIDVLPITYTPDHLYPFGFPIIHNSLNQQYDFEVVSLDGQKGNAIAVSSMQPNFMAKYKFSKSEIFTNKQTAMTFFKKKIENAVAVNNLLYNTFTYLIPLFVYCIIIFFPAERFKKVIAKSPNPKLYKAIYPIHALMIIAILLDIFFNSITNDLLMFCIIATWLITTLYLRQSIRTALFFTLLLVILSPLLLLLGKTETAEKTAIWIYLLLVSGVIASLIRRNENYI